MEKQKYSETQRLARNDTAIEIMAAKIGICITRIIEEKSKPESERDEKLLERLYKERSILSKERQRMYKGDEDIKEKILDVYSKEVKDYYLRK
ncbi:MAG: hypothetical protein J5896_02595 [Alphaproteobacteria bacterium]|nr:hypothetical protein [Alphaproteobacteria bacterium]